MLSSTLTRHLFSKFNLSEDAQTLLLENAKRTELKNKEQLLIRGKTCRSIWLVESGCIKLVHDNDGKVANLNFALAGEFITDLKSLRLDKSSENYLESCCRSIVIELNKTDLQSLYNSSTEITRFGRLVLEELLSDQEEHSNLFKINTPAERYNYLLANRPLLLKMVTLTDVASFLGMSRETLTRIRQAY
jgi:CRP-like cAMP-binding protein